MACLQCRQQPAEASLAFPQGGGAGAVVACSESGAVGDSSHLWKLVPHAIDESAPTAEIACCEERCRTPTPEVSACIVPLGNEEA
jgi:hypothetical protein